SCACIAILSSNAGRAATPCPACGPSPFSWGGQTAPIDELRLVTRWDEVKHGSRERLHTVAGQQDARLVPLACRELLPQRHQQTLWLPAPAGVTTSNRRGGARQIVPEDLARQGPLHPLAEA